MLVEARDAVDLDVDTFPVRRRADAGARDFLALKEIAEGLVERGEVFGVPQHHAHVHDVREIQPRGGEYALEVRQGLPRLLADIGADDLACLRIERALTRYEEQVARADRLGERRRRAFVGEPRGGGALRGDDPLGHGLLERRLDLGRYRHRLQAVRVFGMTVRPDADLVAFDRAHAAVHHGVADFEGLVVPFADLGLDHELVAEPAGREEARLGLDYGQA